MTERVIKLNLPGGADSVDSPVESGDGQEIANFEGLSILASVGAEIRANLERAFASFSGIDCVFSDRTDDPVKALAKATIRPDVFFFEADDGDDALARLKRIQQAENNQSSLQLCPIVRNGAKTATVRLLREGADDVLPAAPSDIDLTRCLARAAGEEKANPDEPETRVLTFMHAPGGVGTTTLAVNTALALQARLEDTSGRVCLIDFDLQFGDVDLHLDLKTRSRIMEVVETPERLDHRMLEDLMIDGPSGLRVLTAPEQPLPLDILAPEIFERIIFLARRHYRYVIIDMPAALSRWTETVINRSDRVFVVTQINVPALRSTHFLMKALLEEKVDLGKFSMVANRYSEKKFFGRQISLERAEKSVNLPIIGALPSDFPLMIESVDQGTPAAIAKPTAKYLKALGVILDEAVDHKTEEKSRGGRFKLGS